MVAYAFVVLHVVRTIGKEKTVKDAFKVQVAILLCAFALHRLLGAFDTKTDDSDGES